MSNASINVGIAAMGTKEGTRVGSNQATRGSSKKKDSGSKAAAKDGLRKGSPQSKRGGSK